MVGLQVRPLNPLPRQAHTSAWCGGKGLGDSAKSRRTTRIGDEFRSPILAEEAPDSSLHRDMRQGIWAGRTGLAALVSLDCECFRRGREELIYWLRPRCSATYGDLRVDLAGPLTL